TPRTRLAPRLAAMNNRRLLAILAIVLGIVLIAIAIVYWAEPASSLPSFFFRHEWARIVKGIGRSLRERGIGPDDADAKLGWLLVVGTIPAGILGLLLEHKLRSVFASAQSAAIFLFLHGLVLFGREALRRRAPETAEDDDTRIARQVSWRDAT